MVMTAMLDLTMEKMELMRGLPKMEEMVVKLISEFKEYLRVKQLFWLVELYMVKLSTMSLNLDQMAFLTSMQEVAEEVVEAMEVMVTMASLVMMDLMLQDLLMVLMVALVETEEMVVMVQVEDMVAKVVLYKSLLLSQIWIFCCC